MSSYPRMRGREAGRRRLPAVCFGLAALALGACEGPGVAPPRGRLAQVRLSVHGDPLVARAVYDIRIFAQDLADPGAYELVLERTGLESNGPHGALSFLGTCLPGPDPGRPGIVQVTATAFDAAGAPLGPPQTQAQPFLCRAGDDPLLAQDNEVPPFVFNFVVPLDHGFADVVVFVRDLLLSFKSDIARLLLVPAPGGTIVRAKTAVTGLTAASTTGYGAGLPALYLLASAQTAVLCLACGPGGTAAPLAREVFAGEEDASLGAERARYLNTAWQMPEPGLTTDGDWTLEALVLPLPAGAAVVLQGAPYVAYGVRSMFTSGSYVDAHFAELRRAVAAGRVAEAAGTHVYLVQNVEVAVPGSSSVAGFEILYSLQAVPDSADNELARAQFYARDAGGAPIPIRAVGARALVADGTRFAVFVEPLGTSGSALRAARCEVSTGRVGCDVGANGGLVLEPITAALLGGGT